MRNNDEIFRRLFKILCSYKEQPVALHDFLKEVMSVGLRSERVILFEQGSVVTDAIFVSDGYVAVYGFDQHGDRQLLSLLGRDSIIAGKSFMEESPSEFELVALPGAYLATVSHKHLDYVYANFQPELLIGTSYPAKLTLLPPVPLTYRTALPECSIVNCRTSNNKYYCNSILHYPIVTEYQHFYLSGR